jgi:hypothetical protein
MWQPIKLSLRGMAFLITVFAVFAGQPAGANPITIGTGPLAAVPGSAGTGLSASYYSFGSTEATSWSQASSLIAASHGPTATFNTTSICYPDCAGNTINDSPLTMAQYVGGNGGASNFTYTVQPGQIPTTIADTAMVITGYIAISQAGTYTFNLGSDDGSLLYIGGQQIINNDGQHSFQTDTQQVSFSTAGLYAITLDDFEASGSAGLDLYASNASGACVIGRAASCAAGTAQTGLFYSSLPATPAPEPASLSVLASGVAAIFGLRRRRRRVA